MAHVLAQLFAERLSGGIRRHSIRSCSRWAQEYRVMGQPFSGKWSFDHHPWLKQPHDDLCEEIVVQKGAQLGWTEWALNKSFYAIDIRGNSVLYVLPAANPMARDFSTARFDPALELSPHLKNLFDDVKNIQHKRSGNANLYIRGSRVKSQLKSVPVSLVILDERDEMVQGNVPLVRERMSGQLEKQLLQLSTPTIERMGINAEFNASTMDHFFFKCPHCSRLTRFIFPDCLEITAESHVDPQVKNSFLKCKECQHRLSHDAKIDYLASGQWVSTYTDRSVRGYHLSQMYSMTVRPWELAVSFLKGQTNSTDEQEFYNSKLGLTHEVTGARITLAIIEDCYGMHTSQLRATTNRIYTMGIDVGQTNLDYWVDEWIIDTRYPNVDINLISTPKTVRVGTVNHFEDLDFLMIDYNIRGCVIDANPEKRKALEFANRFYGKVKLCFYVTGLQNSRQLKEHAEETHCISVDRTSWMDLALGRFHRRAIVLPRDLYLRAQQHLQMPVRVTKRDRAGNIVAKYVIGENDHDHHAHSRTYSEIALPLALKLGQSYNIQGPL